MNKILGSHNSMSYLTPRKWYMKLFNFVAKCQDYDIVKQYELGVRAFDIRISFKDYYMYFAHGLISYKYDSTIYKLFETINNFEDSCYVRLILECNRFTRHKKDKYTLFKIYATKWASTFKNIKFFEGAMKYKWIIEPINNFIPTPNYIQRIGSMAKCKLWSICPRLYAIFHNKKIMNSEYNNAIQILYVDFIGKYIHSV